VSVYYLDTSALVKRYLPEIGSAWVGTITDPSSGHTIVTAEIAQVEAAAAIAARQRAPGGITLQERDDAVDLLAVHCTNEYRLVGTNPLILDRAIRLTQNYRLRGYDAVHLATALIVHEQYLAAGLAGLTFVAADTDLVDAAQMEGLTTDDPNLHP
jgi:predicted nucleic acid-binding protein